MQVNTRATHEAAVARMTGLQAQLDRTQAAIATGKRIAQPSDDPVGSGIAARLRRVQAADLARGTAVDAAASRLTAADTTLGSVSTLLQRAREIGLQGASATLSATDRATLAAEAGQLSEQLLDLANTQGPDGAPLFGGATGRGPAFARGTDGKVAWAGVGGEAVVRLAGDVRAGNAGPAAFTWADGDAFAALDDLAAALTAPDATRAADLAAALTGVEAAGSRAADAQAAVGTRAARLEAESERLKAADLSLEADLSKIESLDTASAIARLQRLATVLEATQASFVKVSGLSLWDRL